MKLLFTFLSSVVVLAAFAQPTIQYSNWPTSGLNLTMYTATDPGSVPPPLPGQDQTWDFSTVTVAQVGTAAIAPAAGTPYAAMYPAGNYVFAVTATGQPTFYNYMLVNTTSGENVATNVPVNTNVYSDYNKIVQFPFAYGQSYVDAYASTNNTGSSTWMFVGYGTLITSLGTFTDQIMLFDNDNDDVVFWNPAPLFPRLIGNSSGVNIFTQGTVGVNENVSSADRITVSPNPAATLITVNGTDIGNSWMITDLQGRELLSGNWITTSDRTINVEGLSAGQYLLLSNGANGSVARRFVIG